MNGKRKVIILSIIIGLIAIVTGVSVTYAYWTSIHISDNSNVLNAGCLNVEFKSLGNDISVSRAYPGYTNYTYTDEYLRSPDFSSYYDYSNKDNSYYYFTVTNSCSTVASYDINLETLDGSNLEPKYLNLGIVGYKLTDMIIKNESDLFSNYYDIFQASSNYENRLIYDEMTLSNLRSVSTTLDNAIYSNNIYSGILGGRESHIFGIVPYLSRIADEDSQNKTWNSKVIVNSTSVGSSNLLRVNFDLNYDGDSLDYIYVETGKKYGDLPDISREGYILDYWYLDDDETKKVTSNTVVEKNFPHTLKAKWNNGTLLKENAFIDISDEIKNNTYYFLKYDNVPDQSILDSAMIISCDGYTNVYTWLDGSTLYYYTEAPYIYFNEHDGFGGSMAEVGDLHNAFRNLENLDLSMFRTSKLNDMDEFFAYMRNLTSLDLSAFDTSKVVSMAGMFAHCNSLTSLNLSSFDTSNVTNLSSIFNDCNSLTNVNVSSFNTSKVTRMGAMFENCKNLLSVDLSNFDTSNVESMVWMFCGCSNLVSLDLSNFNTSKVTIMSSMFSDCTNLVSINLSSFNTSNVDYLNNMFTRCDSLESLDLSSFSTESTTRMYGMFSGSQKLSNITLNCYSASSLKSEIENNYNGITVSCA